MPANHIIRRAILISSILATSWVNPALALSKRLAIQCNWLTAETTLVWLAITGLIRWIKMVLPICFPRNFITAAQPDHVMQHQTRGLSLGAMHKWWELLRKILSPVFSSYCCRQWCRVGGFFSNSAGWILELASWSRNSKNGKGLSIHDAITQATSYFFSSFCKTNCS